MSASCHSRYVMTHSAGLSLFLCLCSVTTSNILAVYCRILLVLPFHRQVGIGSVISPRGSIEGVSYCVISVIPRRLLSSPLSRHSSKASIHQWPNSKAVHTGTIVFITDWSDLLIKLERPGPENCRFLKFPSPSLTQFQPPGRHIRPKSSTLNRPWPP